MLGLLKKYDRDFKSQCEKRLDNKFSFIFLILTFFKVKSLSLIEGAKTFYTLELDDGLCKSINGKHSLPKELTSYHNKSVTLPSKQQLAAYHLLLDYSLLFKTTHEQRDQIHLVKEFSAIYEHSLEEANEEKIDAKFYFFGEVIVSPKVFQKALRDFEKKNPKVEISLFEEPKKIELKEEPKPVKSEEPKKEIEEVKVKIEAPKTIEIEIEPPKNEDLSNELKSVVSMRRVAEVEVAEE
jgi:hypothetical protein